MLLPVPAAEHGDAVASVVVQRQNSYVEPIPDVGADALDNALCLTLATGRVANGVDEL